MSSPAVRRRLALLLSAVLAATAVALAPTAAHAAADLLPGVATTADLSTDGAVEYALTVPSGARPVLTATAWDRAFSATLDIASADGSYIGHRNFFGDEPSVYLEFPSTPTTGADQAMTLRISRLSPGSFTFVLSYGTDTTVTIEPGTATPVTFAKPGDRLLLTFDADAPGDLYLAVTDDRLEHAVDPSEFFDQRIQAFVGGDEFQQFGGTFFPLAMPTAGAKTLVLDPQVDFAGAVTVRVSPVPQLDGRVEYAGVATDVQLPVAGQPAHVGFTARSGARTVVQAISPALTRADGTPGSATVQLTLSGRAPVTLGTIGADTVSLPTDAVLEDGTQAWVTVAGDGDTTGSLRLRVFLDPGPLTPLTPGHRTISVPAGKGTAVYGIDAAAGETYELYFGTATYGDPDFVGFSPVRIESPIGAEAASFTVSTFGPAPVTFTADTAGTYLVTFTVDPANGLDVALDLLRAEVVSRTGGVPFDGVLDVAQPGQQVEVALPARAGRRIAFVLTDTGLTDLPTDAPPGTVEVRDGDGNVVAGDFLSGSGRSFVETPTPTADGTFRLRVDPARLATGSIRLQAYEPDDVTLPLPADRTRVTAVVDRPGVNVAYTFAGRVGDRLEITVADVALTDADFPLAHVSLQRPDGSVLTDAFVEPRATTLVAAPDGLDADGTWSVVVDPVRGTTGSLTLTRIPTRILTSTVRPGVTRALAFDRPGDVQRLTLAGKAGQRPVVEILDRTVTTRMRLVGPDGLVLADYASFDTSPVFELPQLPSSGTWTLELDPQAADTGSVSLRLSLVTDPVLTVESGDRTATSYAIGQNPTFRIQVKAGQHLGVDLTRFAANGSTPVVNAVFLRPDGSFAFAWPIVAPGGWAELSITERAGEPVQGAPLSVPADVSGRWTVVLDPVGPQAGRFSATLWTARDKTFDGRLGRTTTVALKEPTQNAVFPITVTSTSPRKALHWTVTGSTFAATKLRLVGPFGNEWAASGFGPGSSEGTFFVPFSSPGDWRFTIDPEGGATGTAKVTLTLVDAPPSPDGE